jgi:RNA polymerase sigma-70 factor (ECF subfamily)
MTETEIIDGLKGNDRWVFDRVFEDYFPQVQFFATRLIGDAEEAKDIVIRAFQSMWGLKENFETLNNIKAFLYITTRNNCLNYLQYRQRQEAGRKEYETRLLQAGNEKSIELRMMEAELMQLIHQKIEELPEKCKEIFKLTYFEGMKAGEIAKQLHISTSTVTTQRSIALKYLKGVLSAEQFLLAFLLLNGSLQTLHHTA